MGLQLNGVEIEDTYAEAFDIWCVRALITAVNEEWANIIAKTFSGYAVSTIACDCEAGIDQIVPASETPDKRPGIAVMLCSGRAGLGKALMTRMGQCVLTAPTSAAFDWLGMEPDMYKAKQKDGTKVPKPAIFNTGGQLRYFGDGYEKKAEMAGRTIWKIPVMEGEFIIEEGFKAKKGIAGGNFFVMGDTTENVLKAAKAAADAMIKIKGVIASFPGGVCRSGSKTGSKYKFLHASTNHRFCPSLKGEVTDTNVPANVNCVLELVFNGLTLDLLKEATAAGIKAAVAIPGIKKITAGNYGGTLGKHNIYLKEVLGL